MITTHAIEPTLPAGITIFERGWLSCNNILIRGRQQASLVDSGYCTHSAQTLALIEQALGAQTLGELINTHLHSDHCGGNAALQRRYPQMRTRIPPGHAEVVKHWDPAALTYTATGQACPRYSYDEVLIAGQELLLGDTVWQVHCAPGHDPHAVMLFEPKERLLISGDALWERGFGVVFPELEGASAFDEVASTLDVIESLQPRLVIPGHGRVFSQVAQSLDWARTRLEGFVRDPEKHARYAAKVLIKFKLLELQELSRPMLNDWIRTTPYLELLHRRYFADMPLERWANELTLDLVRSGAATLSHDILRNA